MNQKRKIFFLLSHPVQYFSPLLTKMSQFEDFDLKVLYCDDYGSNNRNIHPEVGSISAWDIPMFTGYDYKFLKNNSWKASIFNGFLGLINLEIIEIIIKEKGNTLVIHGWNYFTHVLAIIAGKIFGLKICIRGDNPYNQEIMKSKKLLFFKRILLGKILFKFIDYFLYVGIQNKDFYKYYGVPDNSFFSTPHAVDNERFGQEYESYKYKKSEIRKELGLPIDKKIILTSGKYIFKKRPMDLLKAYHLLSDENSALVFLGDGELRSEMEEYIRSNKLNDVYLIGFKNQSEIGKYFAAADIFVLPSGEGETWGLVVNEAMNFSLPLVLSNHVGCTVDLLRDGQNGFQFECSNVDDLKTKIQFLLADENMRDSFGKESIKIIKNYSYSSIINSVRTLNF